MGCATSCSTAGDNDALRTMLGPRLDLQVADASDGIDIHDATSSV
jgi:hypothetical protein